MHQPRANVISQATEQAEDTTLKIISQPIELTEAQLLQVVGGGGRCHYHRRPERRLVIA